MSAHTVIEMLEKEMRQTLMKWDEGDWLEKRWEGGLMLFFCYSLLSTEYLSPPFYQPQPRPRHSEITTTTPCPRLPAEHAHKFYITMKTQEGQGDACSDNSPRGLVLFHNDPPLPLGVLKAGRISA